MPISLPLAMSAVRAVLRYRQRVDEILALNEASRGLPFRLPPAPVDPWPHEERMLAFFATDHGKTVLALHDMTEDFRKVSEDYAADRPRSRRQVEDCFSLYFEACEIDARVLAPAEEAASLRKTASSGPSEEMRIAYYVVESGRLSRNPALARVILATADTLLEVAGENAAILISSRKTRGMVESLLQEFAVKQDFDDESGAQIFRQLVGATAIAALDHPEVLPNKPALDALYAALNDVRKKFKAEHGDQKAQDMLARLVSREGLERVVNAYMGQVAKDPSFVAGSELAQKAISAALLEIQGEFLDLFKDDGAARSRVLEAIVEVGAEHVEGLLARNVAPGRPFSAAVLKAVVTSIRGKADQHELAKALSGGELLGELYATALKAVATGGQDLQTETQVSKFVADMVTALAEQLAGVAVDRVRDPQTRDQLLSASLRVLSRHCERLGGDGKFASRVLAAALGAAADAAADGLSAQDAEAVIDAALLSAAENAGLAGFDEAVAAALQAVTGELAAAKLRELSRPEARSALLLGALGAINANPKVWSGAGAREILQPLVAALIAVAKEGRRRNLLSEPAMVEAVRLTLAAAARRARTLADRGAQGAGELQQVLARALDFAEEELGRSVSQQDVPALLEGVLAAFLRAPFAVAGADAAQLDRLFEEAREWLSSR